MAVSTYVSHFRDVLFLPKALALLFAIFAAFLFFYGGIQTALPFLLSDSFDQSAKEIGVMLAMVSVANAVVSSLYRRVSQWRSPAELVAIGFATYGISFVGIWLSPSPIYVGLSLLLFGTGFGLIMPSIDMTLVSLVSGRFRAGMIGMRTSMLRLGQTIGPLSFTYVAETGFVVTNDGYRSLMVVSGVLALVAGIISYISLRR